MSALEPGRRLSSILKIYIWDLQIQCALTLRKMSYFIVASLGKIKSWVWGNWLKWLKISLGIACLHKDKRFIVLTLVDSGGSFHYLDYFNFKKNWYFNLSWRKRHQKRDGNIYPRDWFRTDAFFSFFLWCLNMYINYGCSFSPVLA